MQKTADIKIPANLYKKLEGKIKGSEFHSVSDYVVFVLTELMAAGGEERPGRGMTKEEEEEVKKRLRTLGYIE
jgi:Arc/MetJ-type ribon-helix-helix transcriptional regulator